MSAITRTWRKLQTSNIGADGVDGRFLVLSAATGVVVGVGTWALVEVLRLFETSFPGIAASHGRVWVFILVPVGFLAAWGISRFLAPEVVGDGVPEATAAIAVRGGVIRGRVAPLKVIATGLTIGMGGSGGREGPIVLVGASIGSKMARVFNLGEDQIVSLVAAGAGAGIGATFNAPIAGMLFALEVILSSFAVRHMSAIVVASVAAAITTGTLVPSGLTLQSLSFELGAWRELILYFGLAIAIVPAAYLFLRSLDRVEDWFHTGDRAKSWLRPVSTGLIVAGLVFLEPALLGTGESRLPGTGQELTSRLLTVSSSGPGGDLAGLWWVLGIVAVGKILATALTLGSGGSGGAFMPSLFIGALVGTSFAKFVAPFWTISQIDTGAFAVVGMAAMFAAMARAPLTAVLLVFEVTGTREYGLILPLMLTAIVATFVTERFHKESVYTLPLKRKGISLTKTSEVDVLDTVLVGGVMSPPRLVVNPDTLLPEVRSILDRSRSHGAAVVDSDDELVGIITITDMPPGDESYSQRVDSVMTRRPVTVTPRMPVSHALERMAALGVGRLPVVADDDPSHLVGMFRREDAVRAYHVALGSRTDHNLEMARLQQRTSPGAGYYDFRIPPGSIADGKAVRDVRWPEGSTLVSIRRGLEVLVPVGATLLVADDVVTAFGSEASRRTMIERLNATADEPTAEIAVVDVADPESVSPIIGDQPETGDVN